MTFLSLRGSDGQGNLADTLLCSGSPDTRLYTATQGFGWNSTSGLSTSNRGSSSTRDPMLLGYHTMNSDAIELRLDLPNGAGHYDVGIVAADNTGNSVNCGFEIVDGAVGVSKMRAFVQSGAGNTATITGQQVPLDDFDRTDLSLTQCMEFKGDHLLLKRGGVIGFSSNISGVYVTPRTELCDFVGINFRNTVNYDTDIEGFQYCVEGVNAAYDANQGFGVVGTTTGKFFNRNTTHPNTAGAFFCDPGDYVRIDLPAGPGIYEMGAVFGDASAGGTDAFDVEDGGTGNVIRSATNSTHGGFQWLDIRGNNFNIGQFDYDTVATRYINATSDHIRVYNRGASANQISSLWLRVPPVVNQPIVGYTFRQDVDHATDPAGFTPVTDDEDFSYDYNGIYGWTQGPLGFRDRDPSRGPLLAGIAFSTTNADQFRFDLPQGAGTYRVYAVHSDTSASFSTGFRYKDGDAGTEFATITGDQTKFNYFDITGVSHATTSFDLATENYVEHTFVNNYFTINRDTSINGTAQGKIAAVWVEKVDEPDPPVGGFYNPFVSKIFIPNYTRRIR